MEDTVRCTQVSACFHARLPNFVVSAQFDRYLISSQQEEPRLSTGTMPDVTPRVETPPSLFGDDRIARARTMRAARDAKRGLDPRAELKLYLDEPLYDGNLSPMTWWKVSPHFRAEVVSIEPRKGQCSTLSGSRSDCTQLSPCSGVLRALGKSFLKCRSRR